MSTKSPDLFKMLYSICATHSTFNLFTLQRMNLVLPTSRNHARIVQLIPTTMSLSTKRPKVWTCLNQMDRADVEQEAQGAKAFDTLLLNATQILAISCDRISNLLTLRRLSVYKSVSHPPRSQAMRSCYIVLLQMIWTMSEMCWNAKQKLSVLYPTRRWCLREHAAHISTNRYEGCGTHGDVEVLDMSNTESRGYFDSQIDQHETPKRMKRMKHQVYQILPILVKSRHIALRLAWKWSWVASNIATRWI